ncbi:hypothetical protein GGH95_004080 [Coemansia sp. RSA 1836]|nr:hypothetical protein GGH95_004080 [Coemansia sp. RSA 1836]
MHRRMFSTVSTPSAIAQNRANRQIISSLSQMNDSRMYPNKLISYTEKVSH